MFRAISIPEPDKVRFNLPMRWWRLGWPLGPALVLAIPDVRLALGADGSFPPSSQLESQSALPDPLVMRDGTRVTTPDGWWTQRRPELIALFQHYMYGALPPAPTRFVAQVDRRDPAAFNGLATLSEVTLTYGPGGTPPIHLMVLVPNRRSRPAPVVLGMNYFGNHTLVRDPGVALSTNWMPERGAGVVNHRATEASRGTWADTWAIAYLIERGYGLATFYNGDVDPDRPDKRGIQEHCPGPEPGNEYGTIAGGALGYFLRPGGHSLQPEDWKPFLDFADRQWVPAAGPYRELPAVRTAATLPVEPLAQPHRTATVAR